MGAKIINYMKKLKEIQPSKTYLIAIDSDGCVFDAMGIKQRECFCPMMIAYFGLQPVAEAARQCKEFTDLFSKTRGANKHKTIVRILTELLPTHPIVKERNFKVPEFSHYVKWVNDSNSYLSNEGLKKAIKASKGQAKKELEIALKWSTRVNEMVAEIAINIPIFSYVRQSLQKIIKTADIIICSSTLAEALYREWNEHDIIKYTTVVAGQEMGTKEEHLGVMRQKYNIKNILMIGDAPSDQIAAEKNQVSFYSINPGIENASWKRLYDEAFDIFLSNQYKGKYEEMIKAEFASCLPTTPPWISV